MAHPITHSRAPSVLSAATMLSLALAMTLAACGDRGEDKAAPEAGKTRTLTLGAYTTPREAYGKAILPAFAKLWEQRSGEELRVEQSYLGSGAQARAIVAGFEADVAALSLAPDLDKLRAAKLLEHDSTTDARAGIVTRSIVVIGVRKGNPKSIRDWDDLARSGVQVLTPDVRTSGGAIWNVAAIYGAVLRGRTRAKGSDPEAAAKLLGSILANVKAFDRGARESLLSFEQGLGDAIVTYESEILLGRQQGHDYEYVVPSSTISIENPVAVVDAYAKRHRNLEVSQALVAFLHEAHAQRAFADYGFRPAAHAIAAELGSRFAKTTDLFTIEDLGGWAAVQRAILAQGAAYDRALEVARLAARDKEAP